MYKYLIFIFVFLLLFIIEARAYYYNIINTYFKDNNNIYSIYIKLIQGVSKNNYYMNYGYWNNTTKNLKIANKNLCNIIYKKGNLETENLNILDVGCGYGKQDVYWHKKLSPDSKITAVDISDKQIEYANKIKHKKNISSNNLIYLHGDAHNLTKFLPLQSYDRIISLESAFHYSNRNQFFKNVYNLLKEDGLFIITDIVLNNEYKNTFINKTFLNFASDFFCVPAQNLIKLDKWRENLSKNGLSIIEFYDITNKTFDPYYEHFFKQYSKDKLLPMFFSDFLPYMFKGVQPFSYVIAICKKNKFEIMI